MLNNKELKIILNKYIFKIQCQLEAEEGTIEAELKRGHKEAAAMHRGNADTYTNVLIDLKKFSERYIE